MRCITIVVVAGILTCAGCSTNRPAATTSGLSNSDLENAVKAKLASDPALSSNVKVSANADSNEVTISGTLPSEALRASAVDLTKSTRGGLVVIDKIDVKPPEVARSDYTEIMARHERDKAKEYGDKLGTSLDDAWLHTKIASKLIGNADTPARKINVDVTNGVVTLRGTVDTATAKVEAQRMAEGTDGVKRVVNQLTVRAAG
jgi:hyperosmotically inducible protein